MVALEDKVAAPDALRVVNFAVFGVVVPIAVPSIFPPLMSTVVNVDVPVAVRPTTYTSFASKSLRLDAPTAAVRHLSVPKLYKN